MSVTERCEVCEQAVEPDGRVIDTEEGGSYCHRCAYELAGAEVVSLRQQLAGAVSALESAYDAMVHRPVDSELFRAAIRDVAAALGRDEDYDDPPAGGQ
jgi:hypothetical protein